MQRNSYAILSYKVKHDYDIGGFLNSYKYLLQKAIDIIWDNIEWIEKRQRNYYYLIKRGRKKIKKYYYVRRLIPKIPKSREFKRDLRNSLLKDWKYASHYVDSAIKVAYSILNSWRRNYLKGRRKRNKPIVKRRFVRVKETLYVYRDDKIRITIKPRELYLEFDLSNAWFKNRVKGCDLGELVLKEDELIITFRKPVNHTPKKEIAWDLNLLSMDGFCDRGWIKVNLKPLYTLHITYENLRRKIQNLSKTKPKTAKRLMQKYSRRYRNRVKDFLHKLTATLTNEFRDYRHGFENLEKQGMYSKRRRHNREISKQNWKTIIQHMNYKGKVKLIDPKYTSSTCPLCGGRMVKLRKGQVVKCRRCGLVLDRQLCGSINVYLRMRGFPSSPSTFYRVVIRKMIPQWKVQMRRGSGVTLKGGEIYDMLPMNSEGVEVDVPQGGHMFIKDYVR